ncbi:neurogenic protein big brain-like [Phymastichus coffea]|uniref:neurogenic protein big brain-like n=1 Tax=Phymastichus coffea TaxID=108790 RepID=UPI00273CCFF1|nr:neurogenic protein big brain-like [Phymastichus coffea]
MTSTASLTREVDDHIMTLLTKLSALKESTHYQLDANGQPIEHKQPMGIEAKSLELWRAVAVECFATFLFAFVVAGASTASSVSGSGLNVLTTAIASGFAVAAIQLIFGPVSGGHVNPAVSMSFALSRKVSPLRAALYVAAQCGGGIAGAAMLYGVASATPTQILSSAVNRNNDQALLKLLVEMSLSILIVLAHFASESPRTLPNTISAKPACVLAAAYTAATLVSTPFLNPARALGPAFVLNRWDNHWVYWIGPTAGGCIAALLHEYVLSGNRRSREPRDLDDADNSSIRSDDETYDDLEKNTPKFPGGYATYRPVVGAASIYGPTPSALERVESIYGGTKSLYCKSPPLTRANLNRSQSVYAKSTSGTRDGLILPKPGPLVPAQSLYPIRLNSQPITRDTLQSSSPASSSQQQSQSQQQPQQQPQQTQQQNNPQNHNSANQNMQNQLQQCNQNIYGIRGIAGIGATRDTIYGHLGTSANGNVAQRDNIYGRAPAPPPSTHQTLPTRENGQIPRQQQQENRPESMYVRRGDDSAYGSYQSSSRGTYGKAPGPPPPPHAYQGRQSQGNPGQGHFQRHSPNPPQQY